MNAKKYTHRNVFYYLLKNGEVYGAFDGPWEFTSARKAYWFILEYGCQFPKNTKWEIVRHTTVESHESTIIDPFKADKYTAADSKFLGTKKK